MNRTKQNFKTQIPTWLRVFCLTLLAAVFGLQAQAQVAYGPQAFSTNIASWSGFTYYTGTTACGGSGGAVRKNLYSSVTTANFVSPNLGTSFGGATTVSYSYKVANWSANTVGTPTTFGNFNIQWSNSASGPWTTATTDGTVDATNHIVSGSCATKTASFTPTSGPLYIRFNANWSAGDYYLNFDNISVNEAVGPCSGTPAPGNTLSTTATTCGGANFTLSLQTPTPGTGVTYQWQYADVTDPSFTSPTNLGTASTQVTNQPSSRYYRCLVTCAGNTGISTPVLVSDYSVPSANTLSTVSIACPQTTFTLSLDTPPSTTVGVTFQWEKSSTAGFTTITNLGTAVTQAITYANGQNAATYYRCKMSCGAGVTYSTPVFVDQDLVATCNSTYCTPTLVSTTYGCTDGDVIAQLTLNGYTNTSGAGCPSGTTGYSDYTGLGSVVNLPAGGTYQVGVFAGQWPEHYAAWIDYNDDNYFSFNERIGYTTTPAPGSGAVGVVASTGVNFPIAVACDAPFGPHRMRVRCAYGITNGSFVLPCAMNVSPNSSNYGETEDYIVTLTAAIPCPAPTSLAGVATPGGANLTWVSGCGEANWDVYVTPTGGAAPTGYGTPGPITTTSHSVTGLMPNTAYDFYVQADCDPASGNGGSTWTGPITITTLPTCYEPTNEVVSGITATDATVSWTAPVTGTPNSYVYYLSTSATPPTNATAGVTATGVTSTNFAGGLTPFTTYYVWVRSDCGLNPDLTQNNSVWSAGTAFTTLNIPCSGTPTPGNAVATPANVCSGNSTTLSLQNFTIGTGVTYQWYEAATNTAIVGATNATYVTPALTSPADYYCIVDCGGNQGTSATVTVGINTFVSCYCSANLHGSASPCINEVIFNTLSNNTAAAACALPAYTAYPTATTTTNLEQGQFYSLTTTSSGSSVWSGVWIDYDQSGTFDASEYTEIVAYPSANVTNTVTVAVPLTAVPGQTGMRIRQRAAGMTATDACTPNFGSGETEDYVVTIDPTTACAGTPTPGNTLASLSSVCSGGTTNLSLQNLTSGTGVVYQWYDAATNTAISGATNSTYTTPALTAPSSYYCEVDCGGNVGTSSTVSIGINTFYNCYCTSMPSFTGDEEIFGVSMTAALPAASTVSQTSTCATTGGAGSILNRYSNYTGNTPLSAEAGSTVTFSFDLNACGTGTYANGTAIFVDLNQNGSFADAGEQVFVEPTTVSTVPGTGRVLTGSFTIPVTASYGVTGLRVINAESYSGSGITPCLSYGYGETEDYLIDITTPPACTGTPTPGNTIAAANPVCPGAGTTLSLQNQTSGTGVTYQWYNGAGAISGANSNTYATGALTVPDTYYCEVTCGGNTGTSSSLMVNVSTVVGNSMANPIVIGQAPCVSSPYTHTETNTAANCFTNNLTVTNNQASPDVWYQFTLASATTVDISLCGSGFDTYLHLLDNAGAYITHNDDAGPLCTGAESSISQSLTAGTYYVVTQGYGSGTGALGLSLNTTDPCSSTLNLTLFLQGYYTGSNTMAEVMANQGYLPTPASGDCDDITVELHDAVTTTTVSYTATARLLANGTAVVTFPSAVTGNYYIAIKHRNSIQTWSTDPVAFGTTTSYDFSTAATQAYASNMVEVEPGVWAIYTGDLNQDDFIDSFDFPIFDLDATNGVAGVYVATDMNGDGFVDPFDFPVFDVNSFNGVLAVYP